MVFGADAWTMAWAAVRAGRPGEAERLVRQALAADPDSVEGWFLLGVACQSQGRPREAADCYARALRLQPDLPEVLVNLGSALQDLGRPAEAAGCYGRALGIRPDLPVAHNNLGNALRSLGRLDEAVDSFRQALRLMADYPEAHHNLGVALYELSRPDEAEGCFRRALELRPDYSDALNSLGNVLLGRRKFSEAAECYRRALELQPNLPEALNNLALALRNLGRTHDEERCLRRALALRPDYPEAVNHLGVLLRGQGRPGEAAECFRKALQLRPDFAEALNNLGNAQYDQGRIDGALECYRRALALRPDFAGAHSGLLLALHYRAGVTLQELAAAHAEYQARHAAPLRASWRAHGNDRDPERPLRLGFVSADFGRHPVGYFLVRAAEALARRDCQVAYYSGRSKADDLTARFQAAASLWRDVAGLTDQQLAEQVRADGIDILIDLAGHTASNRLLAFARKPAPVQCTWLGYVGTTGLEAIDYLIADESLVPPGSEAHHREQVLRLPGGHAGYDPPAYAPEPGPVPALTSGRVTFGCFNNPAKLSAPALAAFADVLRRVPGSRLILKYRGVDDPSVAERLRQRLAAGGVEPGRMELRGGTAHTEHLAAYREVDIALDPLPYAGVMTTIDALWMGVPVVTLAGDTFASRHGLGLLSVVGLADELVARDVDDYAARAAGLAGNLSRLSELRAGLRERMAHSPQCDGERLANELLAALRPVWREWAATGRIVPSLRGDRLPATGAPARESS